MIIATFASWGAWGWIAFAAILMAAEIIAPGYFLIWLGLAAALTGVIFLVVDAAWQIQLAVFAAFSLISLLGWLRVMRASNDTASDRPGLNRRPDTLIGREFVLEEPIHAGRGRVRIADTVWIVTGPDMASGARVKVRSLDGATLVVEAV